ncbi:MAG TPA: S8 family serine peptidase, partial [Blastocatellia bacterium]|nr:S8 family serine peptidase [Blastocatellia bacterium]
MKTNKRSSVVALFTSLALVALASGGTLFSGPARAEIKPEHPRPSPLQTEKLSADLRQKVDVANGVKIGDGKGKEGEEVVRVILQLKDGPRAQTGDLLNSDGIQVKDHLNNLNAKVIELPVKAVERLAASGQVKYMSLDRPVEMLGHVERTSGAELMRQQTGNISLTGTGIGIAVMDSGVFRDHKSFLDANDVNRIVVSRDFTNNSSNLDRDYYGHGTHVAGLLAGGTRTISTSYRGIGPNAKIFNLRVLDSLGRGSVSRLLLA